MFAKKEAQMDLIERWLHISPDSGAETSDILIGLNIMTGFSSSFEGAQVVIKNSQPGGTRGDPMHLLRGQDRFLHSRPNRQSCAPVSCFWFDDGEWSVDAMLKQGLAKEY
jgi:hypothetical protein